MIAIFMWTDTMYLRSCKAVFLLHEIHEIFKGHSLVQITKFCLVGIPMSPWDTLRAMLRIVHPTVLPICTMVRLHRHLF